MAEKRDFYEVLGVGKEADENEIKKAYRKMAQKYHPDVNDDPGAEDMFKEAAEAYEVLSDPEKRNMYDRFGHSGVDASYAGASAASMNLEDLLNNIFGGFGGGGSGSYRTTFSFGDIFDDYGFGGGSSVRDPNGPIKGSNISQDLVIDFMEAINGAKKVIRYNRLENCTTCGGSGAKEGTEVHTCEQCGGSGQVMVGSGIFSSIQRCRNCGGTGQVIEDPCSTCHGEGQVSAAVTREINVPPSINSGQGFSVRGAGNQGKNGGPDGDLIVRVIVREDPIFTRQGFDIYTDIPLTYTQLVLGDEIVVPTIDGQVKHNVPAGTQPGQRVRLRNLGVKHPQSETRGDQYVRYMIDIPRGLNQKQEENLRAFEESLTDRNYVKRKSFFDRLKDKMKK